MLFEAKRQEEELLLYVTPFHPNECRFNDSVSHLFQIITTPSLSLFPMDLSAMAFTGEREIRVSGSKNWAAGMKGAGIRVRESSAVSWSEKLAKG